MKMMASLQYVPTGNYASSRTAISLSIGGCSILLITSLIFAMSIFKDIDSLYGEIVLEMDEVKQITDDAWKKMMELPQKGLVIERVRRQYGDEMEEENGGGLGGQHTNSNSKNETTTKGAMNNEAEGVFSAGVEEKMKIKGGCNCNAQQNKCPMGPRGSPGEPGLPGEDGIPGEPGISSERAGAEEMEFDRGTGCIKCPAGPPGPPGNEGPMGQPGNDGQNGQPGRAGESGKPGKPGPPGDLGDQGLPGPDGVLGHPGEDGHYSIPLPGPKGPLGPKGPDGPPGDPGNPAPAGSPGGAGPKGPIGAPGEIGKDGPKGEQGHDGGPGDDAGYCPCPPRTGEVNKNHNNKEENKPKPINNGYRLRFHKQ